MNWTQLYPPSSSSRRQLKLSVSADNNKQRVCRFCECKTLDLDFAKMKTMVTLTIEPGLAKDECDEEEEEEDQMIMVITAKVLPHE